MSDYETVDISAQNQYSDAVRINGRGTFCVEDTSSMAMTVVCQIKPDGAAGWIDADTQTAAGAWTVDGAGEQFRVGCKTGGFTSGTATAHIKSNG